MTIVIFILSVNLQNTRHRNVHDLDVDLLNGARSNVYIPVESTDMMAIVMFAISRTIEEIFANRIKRLKFDLKNEGQGQGVEKLDLRYSTRTP